jgi:type IX secretion system PorP/SprF family membrane protein
LEINLFNYHIAVNQFADYSFMKKIILTHFAALTIGTSIAQDRVFTQFYASPLTLNPALTGAFDGKYRVGAIYRDQWRGILDQPYQTFSFGADLRLEPFKNAFAKDRVGAGLLFFRDKVNSLDFSTTQMALSGAYHKALDWNNTQYLSAGFQLGLTQRNINYENLSFQDQWDGESQYSNSTREQLPENNFGFTDMSLGVNYSVNPAPKVAFFAGASYHHFNRPNVAFFKGENVAKNPLHPRISVQLATQFPINSEHTFIMAPRILGSMQGPHLTVNAGSNFRITVDKTFGTALHLGSWVRPVRNIDGFNLDAVVFMGGIEFNNILFGVSYDLNLPNLQKYRRTQNVFEISLIYLGEYDSDELLCPTF